MLRIGKVKYSDWQYQVYEGHNPKNRAVLFLGTKKAATFFLEAMQLDADIPMQMIEDWIKEHIEEIEKTDEGDMFVLANLTAYPMFKKKKAEANIKRAKTGLLKLLSND